MKNETTLMLTVEMIFNKPFCDENVPLNKDIAEALKRVTNADHIVVASKKVFVRDE